MSENRIQLSLFDFLDKSEKETNRLGKQIIKGIVDPAQNVPPDILMNLIQSQTLEDFMRRASALMGIPDERPLIRLPAGWLRSSYGEAVGNRLFVSSRRLAADADCLELPSAQPYMSTVLIYVD